MSQIFHIAQRQVWEAARDTGVPYTMSTRDLTLEQEGFIHCSATMEQVEGVLSRYYADVDDELVLLVIDPALLDAPVRLEPAGEEFFPHIYGPIQPSAVIDVRALPRTQ
jgi:uncharacterized protein (DUF952 family)